jgi:hypothetical protein
MQYRATVNTIVHRNPFHSLFATLATLDRELSTPYPNLVPKMPMPNPDDWHQMNEVAAAANDFWIHTIGWPKR